MNSRILFGEQSKRWFRIQKLTGTDDQEVALCYYVSDNSSEPKGWLFLRDITDLGEYGDYFKLVSVARSLTLEAKTRAEHRLWVQALVELCPNANIELSQALAHLKDQASSQKDSQRNNTRLEQRSDDGGYRSRGNSDNENDKPSLRSRNSSRGSEEERITQKGSVRRPNSRGTDDGQRESRRDGDRYVAQGATERLHGHIRKGVAEDRDDDTDRHSNRRGKERTEEEEEDVEEDERREKPGRKSRPEKPKPPKSRPREEDDDDNDDEEDEEEIQRRRRKERERVRRLRQEEEDQEEEDVEDDVPDDLEAEVLDDGVRTSKKSKSKGKNKSQGQRRREYVEDEVDDDRGTSRPPVPRSGPKGRAPTKPKNDDDDNDDQLNEKSNKKQQPAKPRRKQREDDSEDEGKGDDNDDEEEEPRDKESSVQRFRADGPHDSASPSKADLTGSNRSKGSGIDQIISKSSSGLQAKHTTEDGDDTEPMLDFKAEKSRYASSNAESASALEASKPSRPPRAPAAAKPLAPKAVKPPVPAAGVPMDKDFLETDWDNDGEEKTNRISPKKNPLSAGVRHDDNWLDSNFDDDDDEVAYGVGQI